MRKKTRWFFTTLLAVILVLPIAIIFVFPDLLHERPLNAFTFHLVEYAYPTEKVARASRPFEFEISKPPFDLEYSFDGKTYRYRDFLERTFTTSIVLVSEKTILAEDYFYFTNRQTRFLGHSLSKSVASTLIGIALEKGLIKSLDQTVEEYRPDLANTAFAKVPLHDLLNMTSGVEALEDWNDPNSTIVKFADAILSFSGSLLSVVREQKTAVPAGQKFNYATTDTQVLGWVLETATGKSIAAFNSENLWSKIGSETDGYYYLTFGQPRTAVAGGSFNATTRDYARFGWLAMNSGEMDGRRIVSREWFDLAPNSELRKVGHLGPGNPDFMGYHKNWWVLDDQGRRFCAWGIYGQFICVDRDSRVVMAKTSAFASADSPTQEREVMEFFKSFSRKYKR